MDLVGKPPTSRVQLRAAQAHNLKAVLASAWRAEGYSLSTPFEYELDLYERRSQRYRAVYSEMSNLFPVVAIKGFRLGELYPRDWIRGEGDLDLLVPDAATVWECAAWLRDASWSLESTSVQLIAGNCHSHVVMNGGSDDPLFFSEDRVEIRSIVFFGNDLTLAPVAWNESFHAWPSLVKHAVGILEQRTERGLIGRDLLDLTVLLAHMTAEDKAYFYNALDDLNLWRAWTEAASILAGLEIFPEDLLLPLGHRRRRVASLFRRGRRGITRALSPPCIVSLAATRNRVDELGNVGSLIHRYLETHTPPTKMLRHGVSLTAIPLSSLRDGSEVLLEESDEQLLMKNAFGLFSLIHPNVHRVPDSSTTASLR